MLLTLFKLTLSPQAVFRCICLKFTCPIPNSAWCSHFPLWPWIGTAHSIWETRDHTFYFFLLVWAHQNHKCIQDGAFIARNSIVVLTFVTMQRGFPQKQRKKKENEVCDWGGDSVVLAMQTGSPRRQLFIFVFKLCLWQLGGKQRGGLQQGDLFFSLFGVV